MVYSVVSQSNHPLSRSLQNLLKNEKTLKVASYQQLRGKGQQAMVDGNLVQTGSKAWLLNEDNEAINQTEVWIKINEEVKGRYIFQNKYRNQLDETVEKLEPCHLHILSGDNASEQNNLKEIFPAETQMKFNQSPQDKLNYIQNLQVSENRKVMMVGDGLNDAGALKQSLVGVAVAEDMNSFSPSCDAILGSRSFHLLPEFLEMSRKGVFLVKTAFVISFLYNIIGLSFAVTGNLEPVVAAILMPVSSVSVVLFATLSSWITAYFVFKDSK